MNKSQLNPGQIVFVEPINNEARRSKEVKEAKILKVGNKFFTLEGWEWNRSRFNIETGLNDGHGYSSNWLVHLDKQEILDEKERLFLNQRLSKEFIYGNSKCTLDQLRRIYGIIREGENS